MEKIVKITSGRLKGRKLSTPGGKTHPMGARERLALFNMVADDLPGARVLDTFAGSGALGIEAISRGASEVVFVEKNPLAAKTIKWNLEALSLQASVLTQDVANFKDAQGFNIILADPPYDDFRVDLIEELEEVLRDGGILVLSHPGEVLELPGLELLKSRQYAAARISVYVK